MLKQVFVSAIAIVVVTLASAIQAQPQQNTQPEFQPMQPYSEYPQAPAFTDFTEHPANRVLHFALELGVWGAYGWWGFEQRDDGWRYALAAGLPLATIVSWNAFAVPHDPWLPGGRKGDQPWVAVPGWVRLTYEVAVHGLAAWALHDVGFDPGAIALGGGTVVHYSLSYQRVKWLLNL